jgi:acyl carrier protein
MSHSHPDPNTVARITDLIRDRLSVEVPTADTDLIRSGLLDSLALVMLITALEEAFACELPLDDFDLERFRSVERIAEFLRSAGVVEVK